MDLIDRKQFDLIKCKHGGYSSWAVWGPATYGPKSNIGDLSIFDVDANPTIKVSIMTTLTSVGFAAESSDGVWNPVLACRRCNRGLTANQRGCRY